MFYVPKTFFQQASHLRDNVEKYCRASRPQVTICCMRIALWIPRATRTHSEYVILIEFPLHHWLHELTSVLGYMYIVCMLNMSVLISSKIIII